MNAETLQRPADKSEITDVLYLYCRGVDRSDRTALERVYWPDAIDDHVSWNVSAPEFIDKVLDVTKEMRLSHNLTNILIEFESIDAARSESYFLAFHETSSEYGLMSTLLGGRYIDEFQRRNNEWRILRRALVYDFQRTLPAGTWDSGWLKDLTRRGTLYPDDLLYN